MKGSTKSQASQPGPTSWRQTYFYAEAEKTDRQFDEASGKLKNGVALSDLSRTPFKLGTFTKTWQPEIKESILPDELPGFSIDGNFALDISGKHTIAALDLADAYLNISGSVQAQSVFVGLSVFRPLIAKQKNPQAKQSASLVIDGPKGDTSSTFGNLSLMNSFLDVKTTLQLGPHDPNSHLVTTTGIIIDGDPDNQLWRLQGAELELKSSRAIATEIPLQKDARLKLSDSTVVGNVGLRKGSVALVSSKNQLLGNLYVDENSFMLITESSNKSLDLGELNVNDLAVIGGKIAIHHSSWHPVDEAQSLAKYQKLFEGQKQFALIKAQKLIGRASLLDQDQVRKALRDSSGLTRYFEKFVVASGQKLALQHDYTNNTLWLKFVDKNEVLDSDGRLSDIGKP